MKILINLSLLLLVCSCSSSHQLKSGTILLNFKGDKSYPQVQHAINQLSEEQTIRFVDSEADYIITTTIDTVLAPEAFAIRVKGKNVKVMAGDAVGLMYALLDIKEQLEFSHAIASKEETPTLLFRALKFNLPYDPYRSSELLTSHAELCRDTAYWEEFLNMMAENRFNKLTLWSLHPFNFMVRTQKYPEACPFSDAEMEEWEDFWHTLFSMAADRGIETYMVNWNIFVPQEFLEVHGLDTELREKNKHLGTGDTSEVVKDYTREVVRTTIDTYPNLTGLGITLGEGMGGMTALEREQWLLDSFIEGAREATRKIKFIHRVPLSAGTHSGGSTSASVEQMTRNTLDTLTCFDGPINIELKFNWSHGHSSPSLVKVHGGVLTDAYWNPLPENYYLAWMIRNEDFFILRWGQTDFIRQHIAQNVHPYVNGYYVGSETYIPAVDYFTSLSGASYDYAFQRQWLFYKSWGRLLYNPQTPDSVFEQAFETRFPALGEKLFTAQNKTSKVPLIIASWFNARWDFTLYSEGFLGFNHGEEPGVKLLSVNTMIERDPMDPDYQSIKDYVANGSDGKITPMALADSIDTFCSQALDEVKDIPFGDNVDLRYELADIQSWAYLGMYFSNKLRSAVHYQKYQTNKNKAEYQKAVERLETAVANWDKLVKVTTPVYDFMPISHMSYRRSDNSFHWSIIQEQVIEELERLKKDDL